MIVVCIMGSAVTALCAIYPVKRKLIGITKIFSGTFIAITVVGRLLSGVHWFTDIIGALILSISLLIFYYALVECIGRKHSQKKLL